MICDPQEVDRMQEEAFAGPEVDGTAEVDQVNKFLEKEHDAFQRPGVSSSNEPEPIISEPLSILDWR